MKRAKDRYMGVGICHLALSRPIPFHDHLKLRVLASDVLDRIHDCRSRADICYIIR